MQEEVRDFSQPVPYASITEARRAYTKQLLVKHAPQIVGMGLVVLLILAWCMHKACFDVPDVWFVLWVPFMTGLVAFVFLQYRGAALFYKGLAAAWSWQYVESWPLADFKGSLIRVGHGHHMRYVLVDNAQNPSRVIGDFEYAVGSGKTAQNFSGTFARVTVAGVMPHVLLAVDKQRFDNQILFISSNLVAVRLEQAYEEVFGLYVESGFELEALQLFSSDVLDKLLHEWSGYTFECVGKEVYVYAPQLLDTRVAAEQLLALLNYLLKDLAPRLQLMQGSIKAMQEVMVK